MEEFHVDGLRVDLTDAIHRNNALNLKIGWGVSSANVFGQKLLREWSRTLRQFKPPVMLMAEDHTGWPKVTEDPRTDGLDFDSTWFAGFYHHLIGDAAMAGGKARLIREAGFGGDGPLAIQQFAGQLWQTQFDKINYHEIHDEAGNDEDTARTSMVAVNHAPLVGATRDFAEARCRVASGLSMLSAGTPMVFMGEEVVAQRSYRCSADPDFPPVSGMLPSGYSPGIFDVIILGVGVVANLTAAWQLAPAARTDRPRPLGYQRLPQGVGTVT